MIKNYLLVALRNLNRNRIFSAINIAGLAIGLSACFLIYQYVRFENSYDKFHKDAGRLYRVPVAYLKGTSLAGGVAANAPAVAPALKTNFPEITEACRLVKTSLFTSSLTKYFVNSIEFSHQRPVGGSLVAFNEENVYMADDPFFTMFSFPLIAGDPKTALKDPMSVVISETIAKKYFGDEPALGKELNLNREMVLKVTGVMKDIPVNSHLQLDIAISFSTLMQNFGDGDNLWTWQVFYSYVTLAPGVDPARLEQKFPAFMKKFSTEPMDYGDYHAHIFLQPITSIHLESELDGEQSANGSSRTVYFLSILAVFILLVAWINYINLSTAKAMERSKEVGLRKVVGATRKQLIIQFFVDASLVNFISFLLAIALVLLTWHSFESLVGKQMGAVLFLEGFRGDIFQVAIMLAVFITGVVFVGFYPALVLSSFHPAQVLKGRFFKSAKGILARKVMISFQYVLALLLIAGTLTIYYQLSFMEEQDPGYAKDQMVILEAPAVYDSSTNHKIGQLRQLMNQIPELGGMTASANVPGQSITERSGVHKLGDKDGSRDFGSSILGIDTNFFRTYQIELLEGRMFSEQETMTFRVVKGHEPMRVVVNEEFVKRMGFKNIKEAIHEQVTFWWGPEERSAEIVGVVADHHQLSLKEGYSAVMYMQPQWTAWKYFSVKANGHEIQKTIGQINAAYNKIFPDNPFTYFFLDEYFNRQYQTDQQFGNIFSVFTILAIVVTCLGLLGLSIFSASQRTKEIGIRKVLGATVPVILLLFSKDFVRLLIISYVLAVPVIFYAGGIWLENFSFRIPIGWQILFIPPMLLMVITLLTVGVITARHAFENPVKALRSE